MPEEKLIRSSSLSGLTTKAERARGVKEVLEMLCYTLEKVEKTRR